MCLPDAGFKYIAVQLAGGVARKYAWMAPVRSLHKDAVPFEKRLFFHESISPANDHVVEILPTSPEGAKSADDTPGAVE